METRSKFPVPLGFKNHTECITLPWLRVYSVSLCRALEELDLGEDLKLLPALVEVDEGLVGDGVGDGGVDHRQIRQERPQVRDGAVAYSLQRC